MDRGLYTGKMGYKLYKKYVNTVHMVYYAHPGNNKIDELNLYCPIPFFDKCSNASKLSYVDVAVINRATHSVELIAEIEESGAEPKKVIGDIVNIILSERVRINGEDYDYGNIPIILGIKTNPRGRAEKKIKMICQKLIRINEEMGNKKIELICVFDNDLMTLITKVESVIDSKLAIA